MLKGLRRHNLHTDLDLNQVDRLHEPGGSGQVASVENSASRRDDLSTAAMDGVGVERDVVDVEPDAAHVLVAQGSLKESFFSSG